MDEERNDQQPQAEPEAESSGDDPWDRLNGKLEALDKLFVDMTAAGQRNRRARWIIMLLILAVLGLYGGLIYLSAKNFDTDRLLRDMQDRMVRMLPEFSDRMMKVLADVAPDYQREFEKQAEEALPILAERIPEQRDLLIDNVSEKVKQRLHMGLEGIAKRQEAKLVKTFPQLKDEKKLALVSKHLQLAVQIATSELLEERLTKCVDAIMRVNDAVDKFKPDDVRERDRLLSDRMADVMDHFIKAPTGAGQ